MKLLPRFLRRNPEPTFVAARPGLFEFLRAFRFERGLVRWLRLGWSLLTLPLRACWRTLVWLASLFGGAVVGSLRGLQQRRIRHLVQGVPALVAASAVVATASIAATRHESLTEIYRDEAAARFAAKDWEGARLYYERLFRIDGGSAETRMALGLTLEQLGDINEARRLIEGVAAGDGGGNPGANYWVAAKLLADPKSLKDIERLREAHRHLLLAERGLPDDPRVQLGLARYYLAVGQPRAAVPKLAAAASADPSLLIELAKLYAAVGQGGTAMQTLKRAEGHIRSRIERQPEDRQARLQLASIVANLGRANEAVVILQNGLTFDPDGPYRQMIAKVHIAIYDRLAAQRPRNSAAMIDVLSEALRYDPRSVEAAERLVGFGDAGLPGREPIDVPPDPAVDRKARELLEKLLAGGEHPAAVHMALGLKAWRADDLETAGFHFGRAYDLDSSMSGVANNLAWVLTHQENPKLERALATINPVVERFPDVAQFRDTRGEIYLRLRRWEDALADFERALPDMRDNARLHESLATVYEELGQTSIARQHRRMAEKLQPKDANSVNVNRSETNKAAEPVEAPRPG